MDIAFYLPIILMSIILFICILTFVVSYRYDRSTKKSKFKAVELKSPTVYDMIQTGLVEPEFKPMKFISDKVRYELR